MASPSGATVSWSRVRPNGSAGRCATSAWATRSSRTDFAACGTAMPIACASRSFTSIWPATIATSATASMGIVTPATLADADALSAPLSALKVTSERWYRDRSIRPSKVS